MIRKLTVEGITVFPEKEVFHFAPGINIIIGGNDSGKSHLMKLCYALCKWGSGGSRRELPVVWAEEKRLRLDILRVFGTQDLSGLTSRSIRNCTARVYASLVGDKVPAGAAELHFHFQAGREEEGLHIKTMPDRYLQSNSVFLAPREVLSIYPCYMQAGKRYPELLDSASWELCKALELEPEKAPGPALQAVLHRVEHMLNGRLLRYNNRFYLQRAQEDPLELNLVAEGFKRIGTLGLLVHNGTIRAGTTLFWDEPEMNLNANYLPMLVDIIMSLCRAGVQLVLTTHSLFLLRELVIQLSETKNKGVSRRYIGLKTTAEAADGRRVSEAEELSHLDHIASLQAETEQADRYLSLSPQLFELD